MCFKCGRANHNHKKCNNETACLICAGKHDTRECTSTTKKCINCVYYNKQFNKNNSTDHVATDVSACSYLQFKFDNILKSTDYPTRPQIPTHFGKFLQPKRAAV